MVTKTVLGLFSRIFHRLIVKSYLSCKLTPSFFSDFFLKYYNAFTYRQLPNPCSLQILSRLKLQMYNLNFLTYYDQEIMETVIIVIVINGFMFFV